MPTDDQQLAASIVSFLEEASKNGTLPGGEEQEQSLQGEIHGGILNLYSRCTDHQRSRF